MSKNILGHGKPEHICRQRARNQPKYEIKKEQRKEVEKGDEEEEKLDTHGNGVGLGVGMEAERKRLITRSNCEAL